MLDEMIWWNDSKFTIYLEYKHTHCIFFLFQVILSYFPSIKYAQLVWDSCQHRIGNSLGKTIKYITKWKTKKNIWFIVFQKYDKFRGSFLQAWILINPLFQKIFCIFCLIPIIQYYNKIFWTYLKAVCVKKYPGNYLFV